MNPNELKWNQFPKLLHKKKWAPTTTMFKPLNDRLHFNLIVFSNIHWWSIHCVYSMLSQSRGYTGTYVTYLNRFPILFQFICSLYKHKVVVLSELRRSLFAAIIICQHTFSNKFFIQTYQRKSKLEQFFCLQRHSSFGHGFCVTRYFLCNFFPSILCTFFFLFGWDALGKLFVAYSNVWVHWYTRTRSGRKKCGRESSQKYA